jgi:DNA-binding transcriptional regulator of glucitol operon
MLSILIVVGIAFLMQAILGFVQMRNLTDEFIKLRRKGKVAFGRKSGGFKAGAVVMFRIDEEGIVQEARKLEGTTAFARVKNMDGFEGRYLGDLTKEDAPKHHINLGKAIEDAALTYRKYTAGEEIDNDPLPGPLEKAGNAIGSLLGQKRNKTAVQLRTK